MKARLIKWGLIALATGMLMIGGAYMAVSLNAWDKTFDSVEEIPHNRVGLLLGTSPITPYGRHNYSFDNRIIATAELYLAGRIDQIVASGGDYTDEGGYNELICMRDSLVVCGVPDSVIALDYQGTRTLRSIVYIQGVCDSVTIISQGYHNERAIYLAEHYGIHAIGYNAPQSHELHKRIRDFAREFLARVKMFLDVM